MPTFFMRSCASPHTQALVLFNMNQIYYPLLKFQCHSQFTAIYNDYPQQFHCSLLPVHSPLKKSHFSSQDPIHPFQFLNYLPSTVFDIDTKLEFTFDTKPQSHSLLSFQFFSLEGSISVPILLLALGNHVLSFASIIIVYLYSAHLH